MVILYCKTLLLLLRWDRGKVRDRFGGMGRFKDGLKGWLTVFFLGLIVFMGCSLACVHACFF